MSIAEVLGVESSEVAKTIELVTLTPEQIAKGQIDGTAVPFPDLASALQHARKMSADQRKESWIRTGYATKTIDQAEADFNNPINDTPPELTEAKL
jgi:hypothetical protein